MAAGCWRAFAPALTVDADGEPVPTRYVVHGDTVVVHVDHAGRDLAWPLLVDPEVSDSFSGAELGASQAWFSSQYVPPGSTAFAFYRNLFGADLTVTANPGAYFLAGSQGVWNWQAPAGAYIRSAYFAGLRHVADASTAISGIYRPGTWEAGPSGSPYDNTSNWAYTAANPTERNIAGMAVRMDATGVRRRGALASLAGASLTLGDNHRPDVTVVDPRPSEAWTDNRWGAVGFNMTDSGLGLKVASVTKVGDASDTPASALFNMTCTGIRQPCPTYGDTSGLGGFGFTRQLPYDHQVLGEGSWPLHVLVQDVAGNRDYSDQDGGDGVGASQPAWTARYDTSPPQVDPLRGSLSAAAGGSVGAGTYTVSVHATDGSLASSAAQRSGVKSVALTLDGAELQRSPDQPCPGGSCDLSHTFTLTDEDLGDDGPKTVGVVARDQLGHASSLAGSQFTVTLDRLEPGVHLSGELADNDGGLIAESSYDLDIEAVDGEGPVADVAVAVDDDVVARPSGCRFDDPCTWTFDTAGVSEGDHDVDVTATDASGATATQSLSVQVRHIPSLAARSDDLAAASRLRIDGAAAGDQFGRSVAGIGDVNADGIDDFAIGAPRASNNARLASGSVWVVYAAGRARSTRRASAGGATASTAPSPLISPGRRWPRRATSTATAWTTSSWARRGRVTRACPGYPRSAASRASCTSSSATRRARRSTCSHWARADSRSTGRCSPA